MKKIPCTCPKGGMYEMENGGTRICKICDGTEWVTPPNERHKYWCKNCENKWKSEDTICPRCDSKEVLVDEPEIKPLSRDFSTPHGEDWRELFDENFSFLIGHKMQGVKEEIKSFIEKVEQAVEKRGYIQGSTVSLSVDGMMRDRILKLIEGKRIKMQTCGDEDYKNGTMCNACESGLSHCEDSEKILKYNSALDDIISSIKSEEV